MSSIYVDLLGCEIRFYDTGKYRTRSIEAGDGPPLFLLHGGGGHAEAFSRNVRRLGERCHAMAIDLIWHGFSSAPPFNGTEWANQFTDQLLDLMDAQGLEKASIEGESLGGRVALDMAINHPDRVEKIILNTISGAKLDPKFASERKIDREALRKTSLAALENPSLEAIRKRLEWLMPDGGFGEELVETRYHIWSRPETRAALKEYYDYLFSPDTGTSTPHYYFDENQIATISVPTLVLWTDSNPLHGPEYATRLATLIDGAELHIVKNAGHWPQWEHAEEHDRVVAEFLKG